jgi:glyoxylate reductase
MTSIYVTRIIPESGLTKLREKGFEVDVNPEDRVLTKPELIAALKTKPYDGVLSLLTDTLDGEVFDAVPSAKIFANYAVGFNNIDVPAAKTRGITVTNTPGVLTDTVAEHTVALMLAITSRIAEGDRFVRAGKYDGWGPRMLLGMDVKGKTLGIVGAGRIGGRVLEIATRGLGMQALYYDVKQSPELESEYGARFCKTVEELLPQADVVSIHVPLLPETKHLFNATRLSLMKKTAYLINSSRGPVIDETALVDALKNGIIKGAALDVFENEPALAPGLSELENVVLTPHIASATEETRSAMGDIAAENLIAFFESRTPPNKIADGV